MYVIAPSPLCKAFLPEWHDRLQDNPDLLFDEKEPFEFTIPRSVGGLRIKFNTPIHVASFFPKVKASDNELQSLLNWLTGGDDGRQCNETDPFGIVAYDPGFDPVQEFTDMSAAEDLFSDDPKKALAAKKRQEDRRQEIAGRIRDLKVTLREKADLRVLRSMRMNHNNLILQWQRNEEMKMGKYPPSISEMLGAHALDKEIKAAQAKGNELKNRMSELMQNQVV